DRRMADQLKGHSEEEQRAFKAVALEYHRETLQTLHRIATSQAETKAMVAALTADLAAVKARPAGIGDERDRAALAHLRAEAERLRQELTTKEALLHSEMRDHGRTEQERDQLRMRIDEVTAELTQTIDKLAAQNRDYAAQI